MEPTNGINDVSYYPSQINQNHSKKKSTKIEIQNPRNKQIAIGEIIREKLTRAILEIVNLLMDFMETCFFCIYCLVTGKITSCFLRTCHFETFS